MKNRSIKRIIKKKIIIKSQSSNIEKEKIKLSKTPTNKKRVIKIIDPKQIINDRKQKPSPIGLNKFERKKYARSGTLAKVEKNLNKKNVHIPVYYDYPTYIKKENVDFDVAICISSYDRYIKVKNLLNQIYNQKTKYTYKVFFINDGSNRSTYGRFKKMFPKMNYIENKTNGGKVNYWKTITKLWKNIEKYNVHALCQIDDDFILGDNFLDILMDKFFEKKKIDNGYMGFRFHLSYFEKVGYKLNEDQQSIDGGTLYDIDFIKKIKYTIPKTNLLEKNDSSRVWVYVTEMLRFFGIRVYVFENSLAFHDGNEDSKLNPEIRKIKKVLTNNFIGNK